MPAVHPGDMQKVQAYIPEEHMINFYEKYEDILLLPSSGERSMAEKLSGGDCDGDIIQIIWDEQFLQEFNPHLPDEPKEKKQIDIFKSEKTLCLPKINDYSDLILNLF